MQISDWYHVTFDDTTVHLRSNPPGQSGYSADFTWDSVTRVCFHAVDILQGSDSILIFTSDRVYNIPSEASGGSALWGEIIRRKFFDARLGLDALTAPSGIFCWPPPGLPAAPPGFAGFIPPAPINPRQRKRGSYIVFSLLCLMVCTISFSLGEMVIRSRFLGAAVVVIAVDLTLMFFLWRGAVWARWTTCILYVCGGAAILIFAIKDRSPPHAILGAILTLWSFLLLFPSVAAFQRHKRQGNP